MIYTDIYRNTDLADGVRAMHISPPLVQDDNLAHRFVVNVTRNGEKVDLSGATISGSFVRADGVTVALTDGTASGNQAELILPAGCYREEGRFAMVIKATTGDTISSIFLADGTVVRASTDTTVSEPETALSLEELFRRLEAGVASVEASAELASQAAADAEVALGAADTIARAEAAAQNAEDVYDRLKDVDVGSLADEIDEVRAMTTPTVLIDGISWTSGDITVEGIADWQVLQISTNVGNVLAFGSGTLVQGIGIAASDTVHRTIGIRFTVDGTTCTMGTAHYINHASNSNHGERTSVTITRIAGLMKARAD